MPKTIAEERIKLVALVTKPADVLAPTIIELTAGVDLSLRVLFSDFKLSATGSETVNEPALGEGGNSPALGKSNFEGSLTVFRFLDEAGKAIELEDVAWDIFKEKASEVHLYKRVGPMFSGAFTAAEPLEYFHAVSDNPQDPSDLSGYIKKVIPLLVQGDSNVNAVVGA